MLALLFCKLHYPTVHSTLNRLLSILYTIKKSCMGSGYIALLYIKLGLQPFEVACVTNDLTIAKSLTNEPIGTILLHPVKIPFDFHGYAPDFIIESLNVLENVIKTKQSGYYSEVCSTQLSNGYLWNSGYLIETELPNSPPNCKVLLIGRYYDPG